MTRINCGIPVISLTNRHLLAEHREIKRIPNNLKKGKINLSIPIPEKFCLGPGHVRFFYNKGEFLFKRYKELYAECLRRNFKVQNYLSSFDIYKDYPQLYNDYHPIENDIKLVTERINLRLQKNDNI